MLFLDTPLSLAFLGSLSWPELLVVALLGVLIFGKRLPEVGKSLGRGIVEFKKGLSGIEDEVDKAARATPQIENRSQNASVDTTQSADKATTGGSQTA